MENRALRQAERLTLGVLLAGIAALALSDFVSPGYWLLAASASLARLMLGPRLRVTEMQASLIGWAGFAWVGLELMLGRAWIVAFTDFLLILSLAVSVEAPTPRNHLHRLITGLFLILAGSVLTDSVLYALPLAAFMLLMWRACRALYGMGLGAGGSDAPAGAWQGDWRAFAWMAGMTAALFVLAPRTAGHAMLANVQPRMAVSGFSNEVTLGEFARRLDPAVVLRVEAPDLPPDEARRLLAGRYWRGMALSRYARGRWRREGSAPASRLAPRAMLKLVEAAPDKMRLIHVWREASTHAWMMLPDGAADVGPLPQAVVLNGSGSVRFVREPRRRLRVPVRLIGRGILPPMRPPVAAERQPPGSDAIRRWAQAVADDATTPAEKLARMTKLLRGWQYDLNAPVDAERPVEHFLTRTRRGHCELYASALALAARSLGIPARVVNGYYGGEWNETGHFLLIRQQHAHAWVEAWVDGRWQRFDPTPSSRWELSGVRFARWDHMWETVRLAWYRHVLEFEGGDRARLGRWLLARAWMAAALAGALWVAWLLARRTRAPLTAGTWGVVDRWLARRGIRRPAGVPLRELAAPGGVDAGRWRLFVRDWEAQAYAGPRWSAWTTWRRLRALSRIA